MKLPTDIAAAVDWIALEQLPMLGRRAVQFDIAVVEPEAGVSRILLFWMGFRTSRLMCKRPP